MESYIEDKKNLYASIHEFLEESDEHNENESRNESFDKLINIVRSQQIEGDVKEMRQFLEIIKSIGENHHRDQQFNKGMNQLLLQYKDQIKQTLSNSEIFHIFEENKKIVLFLIQKEIITISSEIYKEMVNKIENNGNRYCHFFIPEVEKYVGEEKMKIVKNELLKKYPNFFTNYEEKREEGENDSYICSLIRQDLIEEFVEYVNRQNISPSSEILPSIFETNPFLIDNKNTTLIEYSAFFGSIQIFQYLLTNKAELTPSLWLYGIHSKNSELIYLLESNKVSPPKSDIKEGEKEEEEVENSIQNYEQCLIESIKCHHNDIAEYIENNFLDRTEENLQQNEEIISKCIKYHNYAHFQNESIIDHGFFYLSFYHYDKLFELLLTKKEKTIKKKMNQYRDIRTALKNNEIEVIYHYLLQMQEIPKRLFEGTEIKHIAIPSSITSIGKKAFNNCTSLKQITIPSSIGQYSFLGCDLLEEVSICPSATTIGEYSFLFCNSLVQVTIPSSVKSIGNAAFCGCSKLKEISIPSSVTSIGCCAFTLCSSLVTVQMPSSVVSIGGCAFSECSSLTEINIPSSICSIANCLFYNCTSLAKVSIPSSVTKIGFKSFYNCSSLVDIEIPSSITEIGQYAFNGCTSLTKLNTNLVNKTEQIANIDDYEIKDLVGIGRFSCIFKAINKKTKQEFAFKSYVLDLKEDEFLRVVAISSIPGFNKIHSYRLPLTEDEKKVVKTLKIAYNHSGKEKEIETTGYITFSDYMKNGDIASFTSNYLKKKEACDKMNPTIRSKIIFGIAAIMKHVHKMGVILRDLKLENIFLNDNMEPVFNPKDLSRFMTNPFDMEPAVGTPYYMAPELFIDGDEYYNLSVDVYAYAFVLYKMFSKKIEFENKKFKSPMQYMMMIGRGNRPKKPDNIPEHYWKLIQKCWEQDPTDRPTFAEITDILKDDKFALEEFGMKTDLHQLHEYQKRIDID